MKKYIIRAIYAMVIACCFIINAANAQWQVNNNGGTDVWGQTDPTTNVQSYGIGDFNSNTAVPQSALHINTKSAYLPASSTFNAGQVFRTSGPSGVDHQWRMFSDNSSSNTEKFNVTNPSGTDNVELKAITGPMKFYTDATQRMCITPSSSSGFIGIGAGFNAPKSRLHINQGGSGNDVQFQMTTDATGNSDDTEGLGIKIIDNTKDVEFNQYENAAIRFWTTPSGTPLERVTILGGGNVGIGIASPASLVHQHNATSNSNTYHQFTTNNSGSTSGDGLIVGLTYRNGAPEADINQQGDLPMRFFTNNTERLTIRNDGRVGIGDNAPTEWLHVKSSGTVCDYAIHADNDNSAASSGVMGALSATCTVTRTSGSTLVNYGANLAAANAATENTGVRSDASGSGSSNNRGGYFTSSGGSLSVGVEILSTGGSTTTAGIGTSSTGTGTNSYGINSHATGAATNNYGVKGTATGGTNNYGVYGVATQNTGSCTVTACTDAAGYFAGDLVWTGNSFQTSDIVLKENINPLTNSLALIEQLQPKTYDFKYQDYPHMNLPQEMQYGVIAEDVEPVLPELVKQFVHPATYDASGNLVHDEVLYSGISYVSFIPILIAAIKDQQTRIDSLVTVIGNGAKPANPFNDNGNENSMLKVNLSSSSDGILYQNQPNPFSGSTKINYFIPENAGHATMIFYNNMGTTIKVVEIGQKGQGTLEVNAGNLNSDIYTYSLVIDGKVVDTKRMVKLK